VIETSLLIKPLSNLLKATSTMQASCSRKQLEPSIGFKRMPDSQIHIDYKPDALTIEPQCLVVTVISYYIKSR